MKKILLSALALTFAVLAGAPAYAQATRTWVSGTGNDANPCIITAPCKTFANAMSFTAVSGEINCLDSGGFGQVTIIKSLTIDCSGVIGGVLNAGGTGIIVNAGGGAVTLRGLTIDGAGTGVIGVNILAASKVNLENVQVFGNTQQGVKDSRTTGGTILVIQDSVIRNNNAAGISSVSTSASGILLDNVTSKQNLFGIAVANGQTAVVSRSRFTNNVTAGIETDAGGQIHITDSTMAFNGMGGQINGSATLANNSVVYNTTAFSGAGAITSFGNNRVFGNTSVGSALVAAGAASSDLGQK